MPVNIAELITEIGSENVLVQPIRSCLLSVKSNSKKGDNEVTFCTDQITPGDFITGQGKTGFIVWFTQEQYDNAIASVKERKGE